MKTTQRWLSEVYIHSEIVGFFNTWSQVKHCLGNSFPKNQNPLICRSFRVILKPAQFWFKKWYIHSETLRFQDIYGDCFIENSIFIPNLLALKTLSRYNIALDKVKFISKPTIVFKTLWRRHNVGLEKGYLYSGPSIWTKTIWRRLNVGLKKQRNSLERGNFSLKY